jgi:hypothetical protein
LDPDRHCHNSKRLVSLVLAASRSTGTGRRKKTLIIYWPAFTSSSGSIKSHDLAFKSLRYSQLRNPGPNRIQGLVLYTSEMNSLLSVSFVVRFEARKHWSHEISSLFA